jgi:hypothetical protein
MHETKIFKIIQIIIFSLLNTKTEQTYYSEMCIFSSFWANDIFKWEHFFNWIFVGTENALALKVALD